MKPVINRIKNAADFYAKDFVREAKKESAIAHGSRASKPMISYMGWTGFNNLGDEILYEGHVALFPRLNVVSFRESKLLSALEKTRKTPLYAAGFLGGGTLINQSDSWLQKIAALQRRHLPIYCFGTGVTQSDFQAKHENTSMQQWVKVLKTFKFVGVRGPYSARMLQEAGFTNFTVIGDTALALATPKMLPRTTKKVLGFNYGLVKENQIWGDTDAYTQNVVASIKAIIAEGYEVRLLPVWDKDISSNKRLLELVDDPNCTMRLAFDTLANYQKELRECSLFMGQKLHATIMACMERLPSIMIEYNPKCRDFMASVDMEHCVVKTSECTPELLVEKLHFLEKNATTLRKTLNERVTHYRDLQYKLAAKIEDELLGLSR